MLDPRQRLFELLPEVEPKRCFVDLVGACREKPVRAHFIQRGLLKYIANANDKLRTLYSVNLNIAINHEIDASYFDQIRHDEVSTKSAARRKFVCAEHEKLFTETEHPSPDWENTRHKALLAYRTLLAEWYTKEWFAQAYAKMGWSTMYHRQRSLLGAYEPLKTAVKRAIASNEYEGLHHIVIDLGVSPVVAATGVMFNVPQGSSMYNIVEHTIVPLSSRPLAVSVLPSRGRQVLLLTCVREHFLDAHDFLRRVSYSNGNIDCALLSKLLLEELEFIHISPGIWRSYGPTKQQRILDYFKYSIGTTEQEFSIPSHLVDLFRNH